MNNQEGYNQWAATYDTVVNKTRDLEAIAFGEILSTISFSRVLELGCGTGKNTKWLSAHAKNVTAFDFSSEMVNKAKEKCTMHNVTFLQQDISEKWVIAKTPFDLITASLVLEHIKNLDHIFNEATNALKQQGCFYLGELHPFKQYEGSKARFEKNGETLLLDCFTHHISDYFTTALNNGFECIQLKEYFDEKAGGIPRLLSMLFRKK
ncbi:MAG TPA: class I SAM-dependent methyltransferase [Ferruginibacter sp.]|nr:class I SAM-dependent methyltransferase [Ferruginibacter sp.]